MNPLPSPSRKALFQGLVFNQEGQPAEVEHVGEKPFYVVLDGDFRRYVEAEHIDRQVLMWLREQIMSNQELVLEGTMALLGKDDLFTKAMIDSSIKDLDKRMEALTHQGLPEEARAWLGMLGFRVIVNLHGEVVEIEGPAVIDEGEG
jgi:hypothetical protein